MNQFNYSIELEKQNIFIREYVHKIGGYRYNWHNEIEIMLILSGKVEVCVEGDIYILKESDIILINANNGHASLKKEDNSIALVLHINPVYLSTFYPDYKSLKFDCVSDDKTRNSIEFIELRKYLLTMIKVMKGDTPECKYEAIGNLGILVSCLLKYFPPNKIDVKYTYKEIKHNQLLKNIMSYIENNYYKKISLNDIAKLINYNPNYTSSFFKSNVGINFYDYLSRVRLQHAISELITTDKTVSCIAIDNGFSDVKVFNNYFKKNFNQSPSEYRIKNREIDPSLTCLGREYVNSEDEFVIKQIEKYLDKGKKEVCNINNDNINNDNLNNEEDKTLKEVEIDFIGDGKEKIIDLIKKSDIKLKLEIKS